MYCKECGKEVEESSKFCGNCGFAFGEASTSEKEAVGTEQKNGTMEQLCLECKGKGKKFSMTKLMVKFVLAGLIVFFVAQGGNLIAGILFLGAMIYDGASRKCKTCGGTGKVTTNVMLR